MEVPKYKPKRALAPWLLIAVVSACQSRAEPQNAHPASLDAVAAHEVVVQYASIAYAAYSDAHHAAEELLMAVRALRARPSEGTLSAARTAWQQARVPYRYSEAFRFYGGPIDAQEIALNTWPIDEGFVERVQAEAAPGIIDDEQTYPELSKAVLRAVNARDGETAISTGYHVIEFLLWGKDERAGAPGQRSALDFAPADAPASDATTITKQRRAAYLESASALLVDGLAEVLAGWAPDVAGNYRAQFQAIPAREALQRMARGLGTLSGPELSGERLSVAFETRDQEHEHSCFSDTTTDDILGNATGIREVCFGRYTGVDAPARSGASLCTLAAKLDPTLGAALAQALDTSVRAAAAIPAPFDQSIVAPETSPGRRALAQTIAALRAQAGLFKKLIALLARTSPVSTP